MGKRLILCINPGSSSTKIAVFDHRTKLFSETIHHDSEVLSKYDKIIDQYDFRYKECTRELERRDIKLADLATVIGRGGILKPMESGVYNINKSMLDYLRFDAIEQHASNLGALIAHEIANKIGIPSYIADPVVVDELMDIARITGLPEIKKHNKFHALNQKAMARRAAKELGRPYESLNLIVAHMGGGITVGAHQNGKVVDVNDGLYGDGPFSAERAGKIPTGFIVEMCFKPGAVQTDIRKKLVGAGGLVAYFGTNDAKKIEQRIEEGDKQCALVYEAMAFQVSKEICSLAADFCGAVDAIILTGGMAYSTMITEWIKKRVSFLAPILVYPGENELEAMADAVNMVLDGEAKVKEFQ